MVERVNTETVCTGTHNYRLNHKTRTQPHAHTPMNNHTYKCMYICIKDIFPFHFHKYTDVFVVSTGFKRKMHSQSMKKTLKKEKAVKNSIASNLQNTLLSMSKNCHRARHCKYLIFFSQFHSCVLYALFFFFYNTDIFLSCSLFPFLALHFGLSFSLFLYCVCV